MTQSLNQKGQLALLSLLIIGAITLAAALSASFVGRTELTKGFRHSLQEEAQSLADSCLEEGLYRVKTDVNYEGGVFTMGDGTCFITVADYEAGPPVKKTITVEAKIQSLVRKANAQVQVNPFKILSRTELVSDAFHQTDWSGGADATATASHNAGNQFGWNKFSPASDISKFDFTTSGEVKLAYQYNNWTQANDGPINSQTSFNFTGNGLPAIGNTKTNTQVNNSGDAATVSLSAAASSGTYTSAVYDTGQKNDFTTASWTASTTNADKFTHTSDGDFNTGVPSNTSVINDSVKLKLNFDDGTGVVPTNNRVFCLSGTVGFTTFDGSICTDIGTPKSLAGTIYNYGDFKIEGGVTVNVTGSTALVIKAKGNVTIAGILNLNAIGSTGGSGGNGSGPPGNGTGGGPGGSSSTKSGNGGGYGTAGSVGTYNGSGGGCYYSSSSCWTTDPSLTNLLAGSGGGAGGGNSTSRGGSGGAGGGAVKITTNNTLTISGTISAGGGTGESRGVRGGGGGGSGGAIFLQGNNMNISGSVTAIGGSGGSGYSGAGGGGGMGRIRLDYLNKTGTTDPVAGYTVCYSGCTATPTTYATPGTYTSAIKEIGSGTKFKSIAWTETLNSQTITMKVRTCDDAACSAVNGADPEFSTLSNIVNGQDYSASPPTGVTNGDGWVQYEATLSTANTAVTPTLDSVTITTIPLVLRVRAGNDSTPGDGTGGWTSDSSDCGNWTEIGSGATQSGINLDAFDGKQWIQYCAKFSTVDTAYTPSLDDITINYRYYPWSGEYFLISSPYNSGDSTNKLTKLQWKEVLPTNGLGNIYFQTKTAASQSGLSAATWCGTSACDNATDDAALADLTKFFATTLSVNDSYGDTGRPLNAIQIDTADNQWFQYRVVFKNTDPADTPILKNAHIQYELSDKR